MAQTTTQLLQAQAGIEARIDAVTATADPATDALTPEAQAAFDTLWADLEKIKALVSVSARTDQMRRDRETRSIGGGADPRFTAFTKTISISDAIAATMGAETRGAGAAREASAEIARQRGKNPSGIYVSMGSALAQERRDTVLTSGAQGTSTAGAALIPTIVRGDLLVDALRAALVLDKLGATFLTGLSGNINVPRASQGTSVGWFAESAPIPDTSMVFDAVSLTVKHVGAIAQYSRNMILNSNPDIDALIRADLMRALAVEIEHAALVGTGDGIIPRGIINQVGVQTVAMGDGLSWPGVLSMLSKLGTANLPMTNVGWVGSTAIMAKAAETLKFPGINGSEAIMSGPGDLAGYPYAETNQIALTPAVTGASPVPALSTLILGGWSNLLVGIWDALDLSSNPWGDAAYRTGGVAVRIIADVDVAVRHPEAFVIASDVAA